MPDTRLRLHQVPRQLSEEFTVSQRSAVKGTRTVGRTSTRPRLLSEMLSVRR